MKQVILKKKQPTWTSYKRYKILIKNAKKHFLVKNYKKCIEICDQILLLNNFNFLALYYKARSLENLSDVWYYSPKQLLNKDTSKLEEANIWYDKALSVKPHSFLILSSKGIFLYMRLGKLKEALIYLKRALKIKHKDHEALFFIGNCCSDLGKYKEALHYYKIMLEEGSNDSLSNLCLGNCYFDLGEYKKAINHYKKSNISDDNYEDHVFPCNMGRCFEKLKKYKKALIWLDIALGIYPEYIEAYWYKGKCLRSLKKYNEAIICFNKVLEKWVDDPETLSLRDSCYKELAKEIFKV